MDPLFEELGYTIKNLEWYDTDEGTKVLDKTLKKILEDMMERWKYL